MPSSREVIEGYQRQGVDERVAYSITTTPWGSTPINESVVVKDGDGVDVTSTVMPSGSIGVSGDIITLPLLRDLTLGVEYRVEVKFTTGGNIYEAYFLVRAET